MDRIRRDRERLVEAGCALVSGGVAGGGVAGVLLWWRTIQEIDAHFQILRLLLWSSIHVLIHLIEQYLCSLESTYFLI